MYFTIMYKRYDEDVSSYPMLDSTKGIHLSSGVIK